MASTLRILLRRLSIPMEQYASCSFRIGAATTAAEAGLPPWLIQTLGGWSSNFFTFYIRTPASILQQVPTLRASASSSGHGVWNPSEGQCTVSLPEVVTFGGSIWDVIWVYTCHLALRVVGWVGPLPHLSSYTTGCGMRHTRWLIPYLVVIQVAAATFSALREHPTTLVPFTAKHCVVY